MGHMKALLGDTPFDGFTYVPALDHKRLSQQFVRVFNVMPDGKWYSLDAINKITGDPQASISARLRDYRKQKFGGHTIERRRLSRGLFEYKLMRPDARQLVDGQTN